jgi:hypothetical protein
LRRSIRYHEIDAGEREELTTEERQEFEQAASGGQALKASARVPERSWGSLWLVFFAKEEGTR